MPKQNRKEREQASEAGGALPLDEFDTLPTLNSGDLNVEDLADESPSHVAPDQIPDESVAEEYQSSQARTSVTSPDVVESVPVGDGTTQRVKLIVGTQHNEKRIDLYLTLVIDGYSRVFLRRVVMDEKVLVDGRPVKPAFKVFTGQTIEVLLPPPPTDGPIPEDIPLDVLFEDEFIVIINKPPGMVVHPAKGHWSGTLTSALAHHFKNLSDAGGPTRPGIVHRLDRDTSGVIAIAKTNEVHFKLCAQFEARDVSKTYMAIVAGMLDRDRDRISQPIGHHPYQRDKMSIRAGHPSSRDAETYFEVVQRFPGYALLKVEPKTGRTHQIRVHLAHVGCPVICDRLYGGHASVTRGQLQRRHVRGLPPLPTDSEIVLERQALHAARLEFTHPKSGERMAFEAPLPADMLRVLTVLADGAESARR